MGTRVREIQRRKVPGGVEITAKGRSARGTKFVFSSITVLKEGLARGEYAQAKLAATETLLAAHS